MATKKKATKRTTRKSKTVAEVPQIKQPSLFSITLLNMGIILVVVTILGAAAFESMREYCNIGYTNILCPAKQVVYVQATAVPTEDHWASFSSPTSTPEPTATPEPTQVVDSNRTCISVPVARRNPEYNIVACGLVLGNEMYSACHPLVYDTKRVCSNP